MLLPDDGKRHEIIDGVHYVTPSPVTRHQAISGRLHLSLGNFLAAQPQLGRVFFAPFDVIFTRWDVVEPDLLVIAGDQLDILTNEERARRTGHRGRDPVAGHPQGRRVRSSGGCSSAAASASTWLIDPELDIVKLYRREEDGSFPRVAELSREAEDTLTSDVLPGWSLALTRLLADD